MIPYTFTKLLAFMLSSELQEAKLMRLFYHRSAAFKWTVSRFLYQPDSRLLESRTATTGAMLSGRKSTC